MSDLTDAVCDQYISILRHEVYNDSNQTVPIYNVELI